MNKLAWVFMVVILALIIITETLGFGDILWALMGPQIIAITGTACAFAIMAVVLGVAR